MASIDFPVPPESDVPPTKTDVFRSGAHAITAEVWEALEAQKLDREIAEMVSLLRMPDGTHGVDFFPIKHQTSPDDIREVLGVDCDLPSSTKVLQFSAGSPNTSEQFGLDPGNISHIVTHPRIAQSTLELPFADGQFDELWAMQGLFADQYLPESAYQLLKEVSGMAWTDFQLVSNVQKLLEAIQLQELARVAKPEGKIRLGGPPGYFSRGKLVDLLSPVKYNFQDPPPDDKVDLWHEFPDNLRSATASPDAATLSQLFEFPKDLDYLTKDGEKPVGLTLEKRADYDPSLMRAFIRKKYKDLFPKYFLANLNQAKTKRSLLLS